MHASMHFLFHFVATYLVNWNGLQSEIVNMDKMDMVVESKVFKNTAVLPPSDIIFFELLI